VERDIDFLFYGWLEGSKRRAEMVEELKDEIPLMVVTNTLKNEMWALLERTKVVINVSYFDNSPLELYRINESLSFGCHVVSEGFDTNYFNIVDFANTAELLASAAVIKSAKDFNYDLSPLDNTNEVLHGLMIAGLC
jgi:hypothetical protein